MIGEREPALTATQQRLTALAGELQAELATEVDSPAVRQTAGKLLGESGLQLGLDLLLRERALDPLDLLAVAW